MDIFFGKIVTIFPGSLGLIFIWNPHVLVCFNLKIHVYLIPNTG